MRVKAEVEREREWEWEWEQDMGMLQQRLERLRLCIISRLYGYFSICC